MADDDSDPDEPVPDNNCLHPKRIRNPYVYKVAIMGPQKTGKSSIVRKLVCHGFEEKHKPTTSTEQYFWRTIINGNDTLIEIEDTEGWDPNTDDSDDTLAELVKPFMWFEKRKADKTTKKKATEEEATETTPLKGDKPKNGIKNCFGLFNPIVKVYGDVKAVITGDLGEYAKVKFAKRELHNPTMDARKRMGFLVVGDTTQTKDECWEPVERMVEKLFDRVDFDTSSPMKCPVAVVVVGNKSDCHGVRRKCGMNVEEMKKDVEEAYANLDVGIMNVSYMEVSCINNENIEKCFLQLVKQIKQLPTVAEIQSARVKIRGIFGMIMKQVYYCFPFVRDWEREVYRFYRKKVKPLLTKYTPVPWLLKQKKKAEKKIKLFFKFRWIPSWCPDRVKSLTQEETEEERAAAEEEAEDEKQAEEGGEAPDEEEGGDGDE